MKSWNKKFDTTGEKISRPKLSSLVT